MTGVIAVHPSADQTLTSLSWLSCDFYSVVHSSKMMAAMKLAIKAGHKDHGHMSILVIKAIINSRSAVAYKISAEQNS
jgi:hypothetical protein